MARKLAKCICSTFEFGTFDPDTQVDETYTTGCEASTYGLFAQGHDAKLAGFLTRAELAGEEIHRQGVTFAGATDAASRISDKLRDKVAYQLASAALRLAKKAKGAAKKAKTEALVTVEAPKPIKIKVGRWIYEGKVMADGTASYRTNAGVTKTAPAGKFTLV